MRTLHGWLAFLFAIPLILASLSGAMLGFARESDRMFNVDLLGAPMSSAPPLSADAWIDAARRAFPDRRIIGLAPAATPVDAALLLMVDREGLRHEASFTRAPARSGASEPLTTVISPLPTPCTPPCCSMTPAAGWPGSPPSACL